MPIDYEYEYKIEHARALKLADDVILLQNKFLETKAELSKAKARIEELEAGIQMHIDKATNKPNGLEGR